MSDLSDVSDTGSETSAIFSAWFSNSNFFVGVSGWASELSELSEQNVCIVRLPDASVPPLLGYGFVTYPVLV